MRTISGTTKLLGVFGHPISHSLSPVMHNALLEHLGIDAVYLPLPCEPKRLHEAMQGFRALGFLGANVTIPFKEAMLAHVDELSEIARFMGSVNTLYWKSGIVGGTLCGTTTDADGALKNLREHGIAYAGKRIALLGNGGAARALAFALTHIPALGNSALVPQRLVIFGRNLKKVQTLVHELRALQGSGSPQEIYAALLQDYSLHSAQTDLVINATSVGMAPQVNEAPIDPACLAPTTTVYDIVYSPAETTLLRIAKMRGCKTVPGLGMLIHQGALSFQHWFPERKDDIQVSVMRSALAEFKRKP